MSRRCDPQEDAMTTPTKHPMCPPAMHVFLPRGAGCMSCEVIRAAVEEEREACAKVAEDIAKALGADSAGRVAAAIRARKP